METRVCIKCGIEKDKNDFYEGQGNSCKSCIKDKNSEWRRTNPLRYRATRTAWEKGNLGLAVTRRKNRLKRRYHLSPTQVEEILVRQEYRCAVCGVELHSPFDPDPVGSTTKPVMDHDHRDGHVRGALCSACNTGLGQFEDDPAIVKAAYYYLKADRERKK